MTEGEPINSPCLHSLQAVNSSRIVFAGVEKLYASRSIRKN
jgi:hypothetical protein